MSLLERRSEIYATRKLASRLRNVIKIYAPTMEHTTEDQFGYRVIGERAMSVEDLVEQHLNKIIDEEYPLVLEMEKEIARVERNMIEKGKKNDT